MRPIEYSSEAAAALLRREKIASLPELMAALGTDSRRTAFRKLRELLCRSSYSHRGRYYTLDEIAEFDALGLWSHRDIWFSICGTLLETTVAFVEASEQGYFVDELDNALHVSTKDALRKLVRAARLSREEVSGRYLYCAVDADRRREQLLARHQGGDPDDQHESDPAAQNDDREPDAGRNLECALIGVVGEIVDGRSSGHWRKFRGWGRRSRGARFTPLQMIAPARCPAKGGVVRVPGPSGTVGQNGVII